MSEQKQTLTALFIIAQRQKQPKHPSINEEIKYIHKEEYYLTIKRNEIPIYAVTHMDLQNIKESSHRRPRII